MPKTVKVAKHSGIPQATNGSFATVGPGFSATTLSDASYRRHINTGNQCLRTQDIPSPGTGMFVVTGQATTGADGKIVLHLTDFLCPLDGSFTFFYPVNIVATPISAMPFFLTVDQAIPAVPHQPDSFPEVEITVWAWDANGSAAPGVNFYWRCQVPASPTFH